MVVAAGVDSAGVEVAGVAAGGGGVEAGVAAGVAAGVDAGVGDGVEAGVDFGSAGAGGGAGLHERRAIAAAKASTIEDALFISKEAFLRTGPKSKPVEICIFRFTA